MKKLQRFNGTMILLIVILFLSCSKKKDTPDHLYAIDFISNLSGGKYAFLITDAPDKWRWIKTSRTNNRVSGVNRTLPLTAALVEQELKDDDEDEMKWFVNRQNTKLNVPDGSKFLVSIHSVVDKKFYWEVEKGGTVNGTLQIKLVIQQYNGQFPTIDQAGTIPDVQDAAKFYAREIQKNGKKYYQFESLIYPGYYVVNKGPDAGGGILLALKENISSADIEARKQ